MGACGESSLSGQVETDDVFRDLLDLREAVLDAQDMPGKSQQQCYAGVRSALAISAELSDLSPAAAAVLAEIKVHIGMHIGQPSLLAECTDQASVGSLSDLAVRACSDLEEAAAGAVCAMGPGFGRQPSPWAVVDGRC